MLRRLLIASALLCALIGLPPPVRAEPLDDSLTRALQRTREFLLSRQLRDGTWSGRIDSDARATAFYLIAHRMVGRRPDARSNALEAYLRTRQRADGSWEAWPGGGADLRNTRLAALALEGARTSSGRAAHAAAVGWLESRDAPTDTGLMWLSLQAIAGKVSWQRLPHISLRLVSTPDWIHPNLYDLGSYRLVVVVLALLQDDATRGCGGSRRLTLPCEPRRTRAGTLPRGIWNTGLTIYSLADRVAPRPRRRALAWLVRRQESDGSFFSSVPSTALAAIALHRVAPVRHRARIDRAFAAMNRWQFSEAQGVSQQFTDSTTWDTASSLRLLLTLGVPRDDERVRGAVAWLRARQGRCRGDWRHRAPRARGGGWGFQRYGLWYPDVDDTALVVSALLDADPVASLPAARRGIVWILGMQNADGGWASWDRNDRAWARPPGAGPWLLRDVSCADITGRVCTLLARVAAGEVPGLQDLRPRALRAVRRATSWLNGHRKDSTWFGLWFTHYIHGTAEAVRAYRALGFPATHPPIRDAVAWVLSVRNADGGWGESPASARAGRFVGAASSAFHTATALRILVLGGRAGHPAAERAACWLLGHQQPGGAWSDEAFNGVAIAGLWYVRYGLVPTYAAAEALNAYRAARRER